MAKSLEEIVGNGEFQKEKKIFDKAYGISRLTEWLGSLGGTALTYAMTGSPYLAASVGNVAGGIIGEEAGFNPYWYAKHTDRYKGLKGKIKYAKDWLDFTVRELPVTLASYAVDIPIALGATYLTGNPIFGAAVGGLITEIGYWLGYRKLAKKKLHKIAAENKPGYSAKENYGPSMPYKQAA